MAEANILNIEDNEDMLEQNEEIDQEIEQEVSDVDRNSIDSSDDSSSPVTITSAAPRNMTFNSQVLVNVEEFVYYSVKLGIKFKLLNNNIVVGAYIDGNTPPPVAVLIEALRSGAGPAVVDAAQSVLQVSEALEREADSASLHALTREDLHSVRRLTAADDSFYCKGLLTSCCKNTVLSYPVSKASKSTAPRTTAPPVLNSSASSRGREGTIAAKRQASKKAVVVVMVSGVERAVPRSRDGSIGWSAMQHLALTENGTIQDSAEESARGRPPVHGTKTTNHAPAAPSGAALPSESEGTTRDRHQQQDQHQKSSSEQEASWAEEQSAEVMTYYINAAAASMPASAQPSSDIHLPEATVTATPVPSSPGASHMGMDPRSPSLSASARSPAVTLAVPVNLVVADSVPFDRPASLSVQQEFQLRNGSIRPPPASSSAGGAGGGGSGIDKSTLRTGAEVSGVLDLSAEFHSEDNDEVEAKQEDEGEGAMRVRAGRPGRTVPSKVVVQSSKHFGENVKKVWKFDLPVELSDEYIHNHSDATARNVTASAKKVHETTLLVQRIVDLLVEKFSFPAPFLESVDDLTRGMQQQEQGEKAVYLISENGSTTLTSTSTSTSSSGEGEAAGGLVKIDTVVVAGATAHKLIVMYFDEDVDDFVSLDPDTLEDFTAQAKKTLRVDYSPVKVGVIRRVFAPPPPLASTVTTAFEEEWPNENAPESGEVSVPTIIASSSSSSGDAVVVVSAESNEMTPDDKRAEVSPFGHWQWLCRRNYGSSEGAAYLQSSAFSSSEEALQQYHVGPKPSSVLVAVNGIRMKDLEKALVFSMLRQRQRPLVLEFETRHGVHAAAPPAAAGGGRAAFSQRRTESSARQDMPLPAATFLAKYSHPLAKSLRKQVDKLLKNFDGYEWVIASTPAEAANGSSPQVFVTSLYRSVESELENLGLFDSSTPQGGGVPRMTESHWADVRMHIETMVFNSIYDHVRAMAPPGEVYELSSHPVSGGQSQNQRSMVPMQTKFAFLSFLTLRDMGMELAEGLRSPCLYALAAPPSQEVTTVGDYNSPNPPEEWRLGLKELCRATEMRSPLKIMQRLRLAVMLLTHAVEALIGRPLKYTDHAAAQRARDEANLVLNNKLASEVQDGEIEKNVIRREYVRPAGCYNPVTLGADELMPVLSWAIIQANPPDLEMAVWLCAEFRHPSNHMGECAYTLTQVSSALEFVKAATWKDFDVEEGYFLQGLERYKATQDLITACKRGRGGEDLEEVRECLSRGADVNGRSVDQSDSPLSAAVKTKSSELVKVLLAVPGLDINMRISPYFPSPSAGSASSKNTSSSTSSSSSGGSNGGSKGAKGTGKKDNREKEVLQDFTALMIAAFMGQVTMVTLLLDNGANRYLVNEAGDTAASLARTGGHRETTRVLLADPSLHSLLEVVASHDLFLLRGLVQQEAVDVNCPGLVSKHRDENRKGVHVVDIRGTALHAAVYFRDVDAANILLNSHRVDTNKANARGETALMWCGASNCLIDVAHCFDSTGGIIVTSDEAANEHDSEQKEGDVDKEEDVPVNTPSNSSSSRGAGGGADDDSAAEDIARVQLACALLKEQAAGRYTIDAHGRSALHWAKYGNRIASPPRAGIASLTAVGGGGGGIPLEDMPFISTKCRYPRLAAVLYYDPSRYRIYHLARDGCLAGVRALLDQGVSINDSCPEGWYTPLIAAVYNKDLPMVRFLLQFSTLEVNFKGKQQTTALHYAAQEGCLAICGLLLFHKADRGALTSSGLLPIDFAQSKGHSEVAACLRFDPQKVSICLAAKHGDMNVFTALINQGVSVNAKLRHVSEKGTHHELTTPLISAVAFGQLEFIRQLMANKEAILANAFYFTHVMKSNRINGEDVDVNATNFIGQTALMYAAAGGDEDLTLYLLKLGASRHIVDKEGRTAAKWAKQSNHQALFMVLICDPAISSVHEAIREGNMGATIAFFKQQANPNVRYFSSLRPTGLRTPTADVHDATHPSPSGHPASLNVSAHSNDRAGGGGGSTREDILDGESPLVVAAKFGQLAIVRLLFRAPDIEIDNVDTFGKTALMHASERGHESVVLALLKQKSNRSAMCYSQKRAIDYAAAANQPDIVDILDADPYKVHIHDAAEQGNARHVNALLKQGCPPNYKDERAGKRNRTALICAASKGRLNVVKLLLSLSTSHSINIDLQDADGMTALMHAAKIGNLEVTGELMTANCKRDVVDARGKSAQSHASAHGFITGTQFKAQMMWR